MPNAQMPFALAMDLNGTGTLVDVTSYMRGTDGLQKTGTKQDQFRDSQAATFTFVLENYDGRFTPGNTSTYVNPPTERMTVNWSTTSLTGVTQYHAGSILTMTPNDDNWALLSVTCDDMLGAASRNTLGNLAVGTAATAYAYWPLTEPAGAISFADVTGNGNPLTIGAFVNPTVTAGVAGPSQLGGDTQVTLGPNTYLQSAVKTVSIPLPVGVVGYVGAWVTLNTFSLDGTPDPPFGFSVTINGAAFGISISTIQSWVNTITTPIQLGVPYYVSCGLTYVGTTQTSTFYVNGAVVATSTATATSPTTVTSIQASASSALSGPTASVSIAHLSYSPVLLREESVGATTEALRFTVIDQTVAQIALATLPTDLSTAPVGVAATQGQSLLDAFNALNRTEQGYLDCVTTGTLTAPVQAIRIRARNRPVTVSYSFNAQTEIIAPSGGTPIPFIRDSTNLIWSDSVTGANSTSQTVSQTALQARAGSNTGSDTVNTYLPSDLYEWGSDRLWRGSNVALRPQYIQIDNRLLGSDRSADLNAMVPGDRIQLTNIYTGTGFPATWDGLLLDKDEDHRSGTGSCDLYTLYLAPCQPATGIIDTDYIGNGTNAAISTLLTSGATSLVVTAADLTTGFEPTTVNYYLQIESEQVQVTAVGALTSGVQTLTIVRARNGTTAASHAVGITPEVIASPADVVTNLLIAF